MSEYEGGMNIRECREYRGEEYGRSDNGWMWMID